MYSTLVANAKLYDVLDVIERDLAATAHAAGCRCGGRLHCADYPRKPRGVPDRPGNNRRFSFCCAVDGCRSRTTPPSVRFLGRKVYHSTVIVLATALRHGPTPARLACLRTNLGVTARTLARWRVWWREVFVATSCWRSARGRLGASVVESMLPGSLLDRLLGDETQRLVGLLRLIAPVTVTEGRT